jgi:thioredoxin reductase (NADPH)
LIEKDLEVSAELRKKLTESNVIIHQGTWVKEIIGENAVEKILLENESFLEVEGIFIELGAKGAMELATILGVQLDTETFSYIETNKKQETNIPGIYAGPPHQMAKAVGEGCVAGWYAANLTNKQKRG